MSGSSLKENFEQSREVKKEKTGLEKSVDSFLKARQTLGASKEPSESAKNDLRYKEREFHDAIGKMIKEGMTKLGSRNVNLNSNKIDSLSKNKKLQEKISDYLLKTKDLTTLAQKIQRGENPLSMNGNNIMFNNVDMGDMNQLLPAKKSSGHKRGKYESLFTN